MRVETELNTWEPIKNTYAGNCNAGEVMIHKGTGNPILMTGRRGWEWSRDSVPYGIVLNEFLTRLDNPDIEVRELAPGESVTVTFKGE